MEESLLLTAIREQPYRHDVRLVYADWLDEHGRSDQASIIRAQFTGPPVTMTLVTNPWDFVCLAEDGQQTVCKDWFEAFSNFRWRARFRSPWTPRVRTAFDVRDVFAETTVVGVRTKRGVDVIGRARVVLTTPHPEKWYTVEVAAI